MLKLYTDAATQGNPGPSGAGILVVGPHLRLQKHYPLAVMSNHDAEFKAVQLGLQLLIEQKLTDAPVILYSDSQLVIDSLEKDYAKHYGDAVAAIDQLEQHFPVVLHQWIKDHANRGAHELAQQALNH
ncbi:ribonuclease HI family protein [Lactobacillus selangorensis]|nr:ribonuclease HI family protein [Lactobacillus selangorensis]